MTARRNPAAAAMARMTVLESFSLRVEDADVRNLPRKAQALLAFLGMQPDRRISREAAADLLWTDRGPEQARHSLRQSLLVLRRTPAGPLIQTDADTMWTEASRLWVDAVAMQTALAGGTPDALAYGASLYRGPLLALMPSVSSGFDDWVRPERARLARVAADILRRLAAAQIESGDFNTAAATATTLIGLDPLDEPAQRLRMTCLARCGRRAEALLQFETFTRILKTELDVGPDRETVALAEQIRAGVPAPPPGPRQGAAAPKRDGAAADGPAAAAFAADRATTVGRPRAHVARRWLPWIIAAMCMAGLLAAGLLFARSHAADRAMPAAIADQP